MEKQVQELRKKYGCDELDKAALIGKRKKNKKDTKNCDDAFEAKRKKRTLTEVQRV